MYDWVQTQIQEGQYASSSDYVRALIHRDQEAHQPQRVLQEAITEGLKSGISHRSMDDILKKAQARLDINHLEQLRWKTAFNICHQTALNFPVKNLHVH